VFSLFSSDLAIDLGTATRWCSRTAKGSSVNDFDRGHQQIPRRSGGRGARSKRDARRTPGNVVAIKPMKDGVIADFKVTEKC